MSSLTSQTAAFRRDKLQFLSFFSENTSQDTIEKLKDVDTRAQNIGYSFLLEHHTNLELEFKETLTYLCKKDGKDEDCFWLYSYYCASKLELFHRAYSQNTIADEYVRHKEQIKKHFNLHNKDDVKAKEPPPAKEEFMESLYNSFLNSVKRILSAPFHVSQIRDYEVYLNMCRLSWVFSRLSVVQTLNSLRDFIAQIDAVLGMHTDVDKVISIIQAPNFIVNCCSVGFFLIRLMIDSGLLIKHSFFPSELEKGMENSSELHFMSRLPAKLDDYRNSYVYIDNEGEIELHYIPREGLTQKLNIKDKQKLNTDLLNKQLKKNQFIRLSAEDFRKIVSVQTDHQPLATTWYDRFKFELRKRHCNYSNDAVWAIINFLTNFNHISKIPDPIASYLTGFFLFFDVAMTLYKRNIAKEVYLTKKAQYLQEIKEYKNYNNFKHLSDKQRLIHIGKINKQLNELEISWAATEATFNFAAVGAVLFALGFTASLLVAPGALVIGCYLVCVIAAAIYRSCDAYTAFKEKSLRLEQAQLTGVNIAVSLKEYEIARNDFIFTLTRNALIPPLLLLTYAICWPAAIALTVMYLGYELYHAYDQYCAKQKVKELIPEDELKDTIDPDDNAEHFPCEDFTLNPEAPAVR